MSLRSVPRRGEQELPLKRQHSTWKKWIAAALSLSLLAAALALIPGVPRPPAGWLEGASRPVFRVISTGSRTLRQGFDVEGTVLSSAQHQSAVDVDEADTVDGTASFGMRRRHDLDRL